MNIKNYKLDDLEETVAPAAGGDQPLLGTIIALIVIIAA